MESQNGNGNQKKVVNCLDLMDVVNAQDATKKLFDRYFELCNSETDRRLSQKLFEITLALQNAHLGLIKLEQMIEDMAVAQGEKDRAQATLRLLKGRAG